MIQKLKRPLIGHLLAVALFLFGNSWAPYAWNSRWADRWFSGDTVLQAKLADGVEFWMNENLSRSDFSTGSEQFDGEWLFGTYLMSAMGFGQMAIQCPEQKEHYLQQMERAINELLSDRVRQFDIEIWKSDPLKTLDTDEGHAAYLGYLNLALGFHRLLDPQSGFAELNDRISSALRRRIRASPTLLVESYPYELYPVDNCALITSIALNDRFRSGEPDDLVDQWKDRCKKRYIDPASGLLIQSVAPNGSPVDLPRGSGTTLGLYFLSFMDADLSGELYTAVQRELADTVLGFGFVREYVRGVRGQNGDIDSGVVLFGYGLSPTGFALGGARIHADKDYFSHLYATAHAAGSPLQKKDQLNFVTGASLGDAILFAMLTAVPGGIEGMVQ